MELSGGYRLCSLPYFCCPPRARWDPWSCRRFQAELGQLQAEAAADKQDLHALSERLASTEAYAHQQEQELAQCKVRMSWCCPTF